MNMPAVKNTPHDKGVTDDNGDAGNSTPDGNGMKPATESGDSLVTLRETAYKQFMSGLLRREFRPGRLISQREIARVTGSSLASVREALKRLEGERIVELLPKRGILIREVRQKDIAEAYDARMLIENHAIGSYIKSCSPEDIDRFIRDTQAVVDAKPTSSEDQLAQLDNRIRLDRELHRAIVAALDNTPLADAHAKIETTMLLARLNLPPLFHSRGPAFDEHLILLEALRKGDIKEARSALRQHLVQARERAMQSTEP